MCVRVLHTAKLMKKHDKSKFLPHTDLTDENRLIYSADAAVLTRISAESFGFYHGLARTICENLCDNQCYLCLWDLREMRGLLKMEFFKEGKRHVA